MLELWTILVGLVLMLILSPTPSPPMTCSL
jgi:hypothetical protein